MSSELTTEETQRRAELVCKEKMLRALKLAKEVANNTIGFNSGEDSILTAIAVLAAAIYKTL